MKSYTLYSQAILINVRVERSDDGIILAEAPSLLYLVLYIVYD